MTCRTCSNTSGAALSTLTQFSSPWNSTPFSLHPLELQWPLTYINTKTTFPSVGSADVQRKYLSSRVTITLLRDLPLSFVLFISRIFLQEAFWFHFLPDEPFHWKQGTRCLINKLQKRYEGNKLFKATSLQTATKTPDLKPLGTRFHSKTFFWTTSGSICFIWVASTDKKITFNFTNYALFHTQNKNKVLTV